MKRKELKAEINKYIKAVKREVRRMNELLTEHHTLLTVEDWRDMAHRMDEALTANRTMVWLGMSGIAQDQDTEENETGASQPAPESAEPGNDRPQNPEMPMMILGVLGMSMAKFAGQQIEKIRNEKDANWVPPALDVEGRPEGDAPVGIENAPESE